MCVCVCVCEGVGLHDCGGPQPPLLQYIHREPGAGHAGEWVGAFFGRYVHTHAHMHEHAQSSSISSFLFTNWFTNSINFIPQPAHTHTPIHVHTVHPIILYPSCLLHAHKLCSVYIFNVGISSSVFLPPPTPTCRGWEGHSCGGVWVSHEVT